MDLFTFRNFDDIYTEIYKSQSGLRFGDELSK